MADEQQKVYMEEDYKTPQVVKKKRKMKRTDETEKEGTIDISVKQISEKTDRVSPIVAYFSSGYDPSRGRESPKVTVYRHTSELKKRTKVVVSPPGSEVEFVGSNYTGEQAARQTCIYTLGVLDKESQTLRIIPIAHNKVIRLEPIVKAKEAVDSEAGGSSLTAEQNEEETDTSHAFWTKKAILEEKKRLARNLGDNPDAQMALEDKLGRIDVNTSALKSTSAAVARNIPPHNESATIPREAYPIDEIIDKGEWVFLQDVYRLLEQEAEAAAEFPAFVRNRLYRLRDNKDETEKETVAGILTFLTHLIKFKDRNTMFGYDSARNHKFPPIIREKCRRLFNEADANRMPDDKVSLLISYVLVLSLHVDKFKTDYADIAKDLRMSPIELRKHFENLGCKLSVQNAISVATLPVPLQFPKFMRRKRR